MAFFPQKRKKEEEKTKQGDGNQEKTKQGENKRKNCAFRTILCFI